jgi:hypothetical protein
MRAYCDDRAAALSLAATLQRENDLLRAENAHLRELVDPATSRWRGAFVHLSGAVAATVLLLGAMVGAGVIVQQTSAEAEATVTREADLGARLASVSPREVVAAPTVTAPSPVEAPASPAVVVVAPSPRAHHHRHHRRHHHRHHSRG